MATNTTNSALQPRSDTDRDSLFLTEESNQFLFENNDTITIHSPHPVFDIPVMETYDSFLQALCNRNAEKTLQNEYDGIDVLCFKTERAIGDVLSIHTFERESIEHASSQLTDRNSFTELTDFATTWFETFINEYNQLLHEHTPDAFETMRNCAKRLVEDDQVDPKLIVQTIAAELDVAAETYL